MFIRDSSLRYIITVSCLYQTLELKREIMIQSTFLKFFNSCRHCEFRRFQTWKHENKHRFVFVFPSLKTSKFTVSTRFKIFENRVLKIEMVSVVDVELR